MRHTRKIILFLILTVCTTIAQRSFSISIYPSTMLASYEIKERIPIFGAKLYNKATIHHQLYGISLSINSFGQLKKIITLHYYYRKISPVIGNEDRDILFYKTDLNLLKLGISGGIEFDIPFSIHSGIFFNVYNDIVKFKRTDTSTRYNEQFNYYEPVNTDVVDNFNNYNLGIGMMFGYNITHLLSLSYNIQYAFSLPEYKILYGMSDPNTENADVLYSSMNFNNLFQIISIGLHF